MYYVEKSTRDGLDGPFLLEEDIVVNLLNSASAPWRMYERQAGGPVMFVKPEDDARVPMSER